MLLDLTSTTLATTYRRWRNTYIQGVLVKQPQDDDDARQAIEEAKYRRYIADLVSRELYGHELSSLQLQVND